MTNFLNYASIPFYPTSNSASSALTSDAIEMPDSLSMRSIPGNSRLPVVEKTVDVGTVAIQESDSVLSGTSRFLSGREKRDRTSTSQLIAEWHGQVTELEDDHFYAELKGLHGEGVAGSNEEAVIPISDLRPDDKFLLTEGAFFRLCISYEIQSSGNRRRYTEVIFRRLPVFRRKELEEAKHRAQNLSRALRLV